MGLLTGQTVVQGDFVTTSAGAGDSGKVPKLNASGLLDTSFIDTTKLTVVDKLETSGSTTEIANNTTTETAIFSTTITGGILSTNNAIKGTIFISEFRMASGGDTCTIRYKYGATTLTTTTLTVSSASAYSLAGTIDFLLIANASATAQTGSLSVNFSQEQLNVNTKYNGFAGGIIRSLTAGTATETSASDKTLTITIQWSSANALQQFVPAGYILETIR